MTRIRLAYVQSFFDKKTGSVFHYFRRAGYPRIRLPGIPGSAEFMAAYQAALASVPEPIGASRSKPGSVSAAIASLYASQTFRRLKDGTAALWRTHLERFRAQHGDKPIGLLPKTFLVAMLGTMSPSVARNCLKALRCLMRHCIEHGMLKDDPTFGIRLRAEKSKGFPTWTEAEIAQFEAHHAVGTKARLAFALLLYTAQRRSDVIKMGRQHIRDGAIAVTQDKTDKALMIPIRRELQAILDATPGGHLTFLVSRGGRPYAGNNFSEQFRAWCDDAGLHHCSAHGLRKAACRRMAEAGYTAHEIAAWSGHATLGEVTRYTKAVDQERIARAAMDREQKSNPSVKPDRAKVSSPLVSLAKK
jgi:integrase